MYIIFSLCPLAALWRYNVHCVNRTTAGECVCVWKQKGLCAMSETRPDEAIQSVMGPRGSNGMAENA